MIELSKCPNCASEDKVTIAGKDFCMRCGTPNSDQTPVVAQPAEQPVTNELPTPVPQVTPSVAKFNDTPAGSTTPSPEVPDGQVIPNEPPMAPVAVQNTMPNGAPSSNTATAPPVPQPTNEMQVQQPVLENTMPVPEINSNPQVMQSQPMQDAAVMAAIANPAANPVAQPGAIPIQAFDQAQNQAPNSNPVVAPPQQQQLMPEPPPPAPTPDPVQISTDTPLTQEDVAEIKPVAEQAEIPKIHTHQAIMSLDKNDSGVFSDEQLDELGKNMSDQTEPITRTPEQHKTITPDTNTPAQTTFHTDIRPPSKESQPTQGAQTAVSQVAQNDIKIPDKSSKTKKVLKPAGIAMSIVTLFLVGAYIWQVNYPTLAFKIASAKAGMSATMPGYIPGGYKLAGEIQTNPGSVSYSLVNGGQSKKISITQTKTDWDSQALAESYVAPKAENYLALQAQGLTIYMLGDSQATWVNKGTWYKIESPDQSLSQDQAIKIATSL